MSSSELKGIAILGAGLFVLQAYIPSLAALGSDAPPLKAVYSRSEKSAREVSETATKVLGLAAPADVYFDGDHEKNLAALFERPDITAVIIALPITVQPEIVLKALAAGKHVLSEKPVAPDVAQGLKLIKDASQYVQNGLVWRVAEDQEAEPVYRAARDAVKFGKIGPVIFFKAAIVNYIDKSSQWYKTPWRTVPDYQGGFLLDGGVHTIAALRTMLSANLTHLSGIASLNKDYLLPHDTIHSVVRVGSHYHGLVEMTWGFPTKSKPAADNLVITGTEGWLAVNRLPDGFKIVIKSLVKGKEDTDDETSYEEQEEETEYPSKGVEVELKSFFGKIQGKDDVLDIGDPLEALGDVAFIQASLNSKGNLIDLTELLHAPV